MVTGKKVFETMKPYKQGMQIEEVKQKYQLNKIVKLASNENPYGYSKAVLSVLNNISKHFELYPDGYAANLREKIADKHEIEGDQIVFGAGSDEIIAMICRAFLEKNDNTIMAEHTFPQYQHHAKIEGADVKIIETKDGFHQLDKMYEAIDDETKVVWICAPDNPTGTMIEKSQLDTFLQACPKDVLVVLDIAYDEFVADDKKLPYLAYIQEYSNVIVLKTLSKAYGIAAFRVGYGLTSESVARQLNIVRGPFNVTSMSLKVAEAVLDDEDFLTETITANRRVKVDFEQFLRTLGFDYYPSETNFLLVKTPINATKFADFLLENGFIVRSGDLLGYPKTVRITIGTKEEMDDLKKVFEAFMNKS